MKKKLTNLERNVKIRFFIGDTIEKIAKDKNKSIKQITNIINRIKLKLNM